VSLRPQALVLTAVAALVAGLAVGATGPVSAARALPSSGRVSSHTLLDALTVGSTYHSGYVRTKFRLWSNHSDGCNTRHQVLIRDAVKRPSIGAGCYLTGGRWVSPYDGFTTTNPTKIQIDHVVPLAVAWGSGAWRWTTSTREAYANDLGTTYDLLAVSGHTNESKGDSPPSEWLPPKQSFDCRYMADYTAVLWRWRLTINKAEKAFLTKHLRACGWPGVDEPTRPPIVHKPGGGGHGGGRVPATASGVRIASIYFDSPGDDTGSAASLDAEWVQITNTGNKSATLTNWVLHDASSHRFVFPSEHLAAHASLKVHTGSGRNTRTNLFWDETSYIWNNTGDTATLLAANGAKADACTYTESADPKAIC
jgi:Lamin Tail Domain/Protein of unknown function (DUF1524)